MKDFAVQLEPDPSLEKVLRPVFKVVRDENGKIIQGLFIGPTQAQNEALILSSTAGSFKNSPTLGVGLENALLSDNSEMLGYRHSVRRNYELDGLEIDRLDMYDIEKIKITAHYR